MKPTASTTPAEPLTILEILSQVKAKKPAWRAKKPTWKVPRGPYVKGGRSYGDTDLEFR